MGPRSGLGACTGIYKGCADTRGFNCQVTSIPYIFQNIDLDSEH